MRIKEHPILDFKKKKEVKFYFNSKEFTGYEGEPVITALRANGVIKVRESSKDHKPLGPFCMQGRCSACLMNIDGKPDVMSCVTPLKEGMVVYYRGTELDKDIFNKNVSKFIFDEEINKHEEYDIAIVGAGPAGMEAAIVAAESGVPKIILLDDKEYLGGQLALQTHTFFGTRALGAAKRGITIAKELSDKIKTFNSVSIKLNSTVLGVYPKNVLIFKENGKLTYIKAKKIIFATGASEKTLSFEGNYLPGVMGAGAAQTFMNIHGVKPGNEVLIVGGGNIGVILAYQLMQAGVKVVGLIEAANKFGAYGVHVDKVKALGLKTYIKHTIVKAIKDEKEERVGSAVIAELDENFCVICGTEKTIKCDTICLSVGLNPLNELLWQAGCDFKYINSEVVSFDKYRNTSVKDIFVAGDCAVIGEASIARLEGRIAGLKASSDLGFSHKEFNEKTKEAFSLLENIQKGSFGEDLAAIKKEITGEKLNHKFNPKPYHQSLNASNFKANEARIMIDCTQDIPCNPCEKACPKGAIKIGEEINQMPSVDIDLCTGCGLCLLSCPGRAILMVQYNYDNDYSKITMPYEFLEPEINSTVEVLNKEGTFICKGKVIKTKYFEDKEKCSLIEILIPKEHAFFVRAVRKQENIKLEKSNSYEKDKNYVCRCEEITYEDVLNFINQGYDNIHELRRVTRIGMGPCRGNQCRSTLEQILKRHASKTSTDILKDKLKRRTVFRSPIKRITLSEAANLNFTNEEYQEIRKNSEQVSIPLEKHNIYIDPKVEVKSELKKNIVIIGGGIAGVCTAWELAKLGVEGIIVLEKDFLCSGASSAALGGIRTGFSSANKIRRASYGLEFFKNAKQTLGRDIGWHQGGYVYLAYDEKTDKMFKEYIGIWNSTGVKAKYTNEIEKHVPGLANSLSAVIFPEAGGANPFLSTYYVAKAAKDLGVEFIKGEEVSSIEVENGTAKSCITSKGRKIKFNHIINCAGSYCVKVAKMVNIDLSKKVFIDRHESVVTEKAPLFLDPLIVSYHPSLSGYWQQKRTENLNEGEIVACFTPEPPLYGYNTSTDIMCLSRMAKSILYSQPSLKDLGILRTYAHHYVGQKSGTAIIGESAVKGFWFNIAKKGHGYMCAPGDAHALAYSIVNKETHPWISDCVIDSDDNLNEVMA